MSRRNSLIAKKLSKISQNLPNSTLVKQEDTEDLKKKFNDLRESAEQVAECLAYQFGRGGRNPLEVAFQQGLLTEIERDRYQLEVDLYLQQWKIICQGWEHYLKEIFAVIGISSEIELFQAVLQDIYDGCFTAAKEGYTINYQKRETALRVFRKAHWKPTPKETVEEFRKPENLKLLENQYIHVNIFHWDIVTQTLRPECKKNRTLKRKFEEFSRLVVESVDLETKRLEEKRKKGETCSVKYESGHRFEGVKGGWKKVT